MGWNNYLLEGMDLYNINNLISLKLGYVFKQAYRMIRQIRN